MKEQKNKSQKDLKEEPKKRKPKRKVENDGRPRIEIDWETLDSLCEIQCTASEIAGILKCSVDTIERSIKKKYGSTFAEYFKIKSSTGKMSLRRKQYNAAIDGSVPMMIWLGKQWLDQRDQPKDEERKTNTIIAIPLSTSKSADDWVKNVNHSLELSHDNKDE